MADGTKITLEFQATGADQVVGEIHKVEAAEEGLSLQQQRDLRTKGTSYGTATPAGSAAAQAEQEARQAAARLSIEKAVAEAQENRIAMGREAAAAQSKADVAQLIAAREKLLLEEKNTAEVLKRAAMRAVLPESRLNEAGRMVAKNGEAVTMLGNAAKTFITGPWGVLVAGMAAGAGVIGKVGEQFDRVRQLMPELANQMPVTEAIVHPWEVTKRAVGAACDGIGAALDKVFLGGSYARMKANVDEAVAHKQMADDMAASYKKAAEAHKKMADDMRADAVGQLLEIQTQEARLLVQALEGKSQLDKSRGSLEASREKRSGTDAGTMAVNAVNRAVSDDANAESIARQAVALADANLANLIAKQDANRESGTVDAALNRAVIKARGDADAAAEKYKTLIADHDIQLTQAAEEAMGTVATETGGKITAAAQAAAATMQQVADENGGQLAGTAKGAMDRLTAILTDAIPDEKQVDAINQAMKAFRGSQDAANAGVVGNFDAMLSNMNGLLQEITRHRGEISAMQSAIKQLVGRSR